MIDSVGKLIISIVTLGIFTSFGVYVFVWGVPQDMHDIVLQMEGALIAWGTQVIGYWVGSSAGSAHKDQTIREQLVIPPPSGAAGIQGPPGPPGPPGIRGPQWTQGEGSVMDVGRN